MSACRLSNTSSVFLYDRQEYGKSSIRYVKQVPKFDVFNSTSPFCPAELPQVRLVIRYALCRPWPAVTSKFAGRPIRHPRQICMAL